MTTRYGAGDRTRTGTLSPAVDFESTTSTNSITPAGERTHYSGPTGEFQVFFPGDEKMLSKPGALWYNENV